MNKNSGSIAVFLVLAALYFFSIFHRVGTASVASNLAIDFNTDNSILGLMSGMYFYSYALAQIPAGIMLDRIGIRKTLTLLGLVATVGNLVFCISPTIAILSLGRGLIGFGVGGFYVAALKTLAVSYNPKRYGTLTSVFTAIGNIGGVAASSPLALLTLAIGWRESFLIIFLLMFFFVGVSWFVTEKNENKQFVTKSSIRDNFVKIFSNRELLKIVPVPFFIYGCFVSFQGLWAGPFLMNVYGMSKALASLFFMFITIGFIFSFPLAGLVSDRIGKRKPVLLSGIVLSLLFWIIMAFFGEALSSYQIVALFIFLGFSYGITCIFLTLPATMFPLEISGSAIAALNIFNFVGGGFFQYFMGFVIDSTAYAGNAFFSYHLIFVICALCALITLGIAILFKER